MKDRSDDPSHHERTLLPRSYNSLPREETCCCHMGYSFQLTARVLLYAPSHRQDNTYYGGAREPDLKIRKKAYDLQKWPTFGPVYKPTLGWSRYRDANQYLKSLRLTEMGWSRYRDANQYFKSLRLTEMASRVPLTSTSGRSWNQAADRLRAMLSEMVIGSRMIHSASTSPLFRMMALQK